MIEAILKIILIGVATVVMMFILLFIAFLIRAVIKEFKKR